MPLSRASLLHTALLTSFALPAAAAEISFKTPALSTAEVTTASNWVGGVAPGAADIAAWKTDGDPATAGNQEARGGVLTIASPVSWLGIRHEDSVGPLTLTGADITLGSSGITEVRWEPLTIQNNIILGANQTWNNGTTLTVSGIVSGSFGLTKSGGGVLTLSGANTFDGPITVANGTLVVSSLNSVIGGSASSSLGAPTTAANGTISLGGGGDQGALTYTGSGETTDRVVNLSGAAGGAMITQDGYGLLRFTSATTVTGSGAKGVTLTGNGNGEISGFGSLGGLTNLTKSGLGTWTLTGASAQSGGAVNVNGGILAYTSTATRTSGTFTRSGTGVLEIASGAGIITSTANTNGILGGWATFGDTTWAVANGASDITGLSTFTSDTWAAGNNTDVTLAGANPATGSTTHSLRFNEAGTKTLTLAGTNTLTSGGLMVTSNVGENLTTITGGTLVGANTADLIVHQNNSAGALTIASIIANNTGATGLTKTGSGLLTLSGANIYTGATTVLEGTLEVQNKGTGAANYLVGQNGTLRLGYNIAQSYDGQATIHGSGTAATTGLYLQGGRTITFQTSGGNGLVLASGPTTVRTYGTGNAILSGYDNRYNSLLSNSAASGSVFVSTINFTGGSFGYVFNVAAGANTVSGDTTINGQFTGGSTFIKLGNGSLNLTGASTHTSALDVRDGSVILTGGGNRLGTGSSVILGNGSTSGRLMLDGIAQTLTNLSNVGTGTTNAVVGKSATLSTLTVNYTGAGQTFSGTLGGSATNANNIAFAKTGSGTYTLSGTNTYTGGTTLTGGLLSLGSAGALGTTGTISMNGGGLQFSAANTTDYSSRLKLEDATTSVFDTNGQSVTFANSLALGTLGTGGFTKAGLGTLILSGANTHTGATNVSAGTLALAGADNRLIATGSLVLGSGTSGGTLRLDGISQTLASISTSGSGTNRVIGGSATAASLVINNSGSVTFGGILGGPGTNENNFSLTKSGAGTLTLSGANTFDGGTTLNTGTLSFANGSLGTTGSIAMNGGTLQWNGTNTQDLSGRIVMIDTQAATFDTNGNNVTFAGSIGSSTTGSLVKTGNGILTLAAANTYSGGTTLTAGTLSFANGALGTTGSIAMNGGTLQWNGTNTEDLSGRIAMVTAKAAIFDTNGNNITFATSIGSTTTGSLVKTGGGTLTLSAANTYSGSTTINSGTLSISADNHLGTAPVSTTAGNLVINGGIFAVTTGFTLDSKRGIALGTTGSGSGTISVASGQTLNYGGIIANNGGTGSLIKAGAGTLNLTSSSSYTGTTTLDGGVLRASASGSLSGTSGITVNTGSTLETNGTNVFVANHDAAVANSKVVTLNNASWIMTASHDARVGNVTLNNGSTWTSNRVLTGYDALLANTTTGAATVAVTGSGASVMNGTGGLHLQGVQNFNVADTTGNANADLTVSLTLDNAGSTGGAAGGINKLGGGTMAISKQTTYTGGTTVTAGVLDLTGTGGSGGIIRGTVTVNNGGTLRFSAGDVTGYGTGSDRLSVINVNAGGTLHVNTVSNQTLGNAAINLTGGAITGIANSNIDFYQGSSAVNSLASATSSTISGTRLTMRQNNGVTFNVANGAASQDLVVDSVIANATGFTNNHLTKTGAGTMVLNATNTYTTETRVQEGTLIVNGSIGSGTVTVADNATLGGSGTIAGNVIFQDGATHAPGTSPGLPTLGSADYQTGSIFQWELVSNTTANRGTAFDGVNVTNSLTVGTGALFDIILNGSGSAVNFTDAFWSESRSWNVFTATSVAGLFTLGTVSTDSVGNSYSPYGNFTFTGTSGNLSLEWSAVPEPSSALAGLLLTAAMLRRRRR